MILTGPLPGQGDTLVIEASAGTGKTWTMSRLAARFLAETPLTVDQLAIVTFSAAAAAEVRDRTRAWIAQCADDPALPADQRARLGRALADIDKAAIHTTHGFCDQLLSRLGILADHDHTDRLTTSLTDLAARVTADRYLAWTTAGAVPFGLAQAQAWVKKALFAPTAPVVPAGEAARFVTAVRDEVEARKRGIGRYTFDDMLVRCRDALADPTTGAAARARVARMYPVVLVDEFQDTDPVQWDVIRLGFVGVSAVVLIGDPKQSIYGFRGADIQAYLGATRQARTETLDINHRSSPALIAALAGLTGGAELGDPRIAVGPVGAADDAPRLVAPAGAPWGHPIRIRVPAKAEPRPIGAARAAIDADLVTDIAALLGAGVRYCPGGGAATRSLGAEDIAVIVATNGRGQTIATALAAVGIPAVFTGTGSVFATPAARDWLIFLQGLAAGTGPRLRAAALTSLAGWDLARLASAGPDDIATLNARLRALNTLLNDAGPLAVFEWLTDRTDLPDRVAAQHLADLAQIARLLGGPRPVGQSAAEWLAAAITSGGDTDEYARHPAVLPGAVRVLTVHQAKGLQFPVVYLPQLADRYVMRPKPDEAVVAHDDLGRRVVDLGTDGGSPARARAAADDAGESLRAGYVALTRATVHITTWWVPSTLNLEASALHRLLVRTGHPDPRDLTLPGVAVETIPDAASPAPAGPPVVLTYPVAARPVLGRPIDHTWRRTSFTALTAATHADQPPAYNPPAGDPALDRMSPMADLPGGLAFGSLVHSVFEYADLTAADLTDQVAAAMAAVGWTEPDAPTLAAALLPGLTTPLGPLLDGLSLAQIPPADRLAEVGFEMSLADGGPAGTLADIATLLRRHLADDDPLAAYPDHLAGVEAQALRGYLSGSIDVVARVAGRYVILDYKTNRLGPPEEPLTLRHYTLPAMAAAMIGSHYPLQALVYAVALHRFLRGRLPGYAPDRHLGGMAYLFVRGMAGPDTPVRDGTPCGVFGWRPPARLIEDLSDLLEGVTP